MRVTKNIHLVASGAAGVSLTDSYDCNAWLIETAEGLALFDTGAGRDVPAMLAEMEAAGLDPADIGHVFLTHAHADHSGGAAELRRRLPGLVLHAGAEAADRLASDDETRISLDRARRLGVYPPDYVWRGVAVDDLMADGTVASVGDAQVQLLALPGHSDDSCAFLVRLDGRAILVAGDTVFADGRVVLQDIPDCSVALTLASIRRLSGVAFEVFLPGHGAFALQDGMRHVARARRYADSGLPPPSFF